MKKFVLLSLILLSGCAVHSDEWQTAEDVCSANGGVQYVTQDLYSTVIHCKNDAVFRL